MKIIEFYTFRSRLKFAFALLIFLILSSTQIFATEYFVNSISGNDSNAGTSSSTPWKSIAKVEFKTLQPGDIVNFARGSSWSKAAWETVFLIDDSGTKASPITFRAYGEGALPAFSNVRTGLEQRHKNYRRLYCY